MSEILDLVEAYGDNLVDLAANPAEDLYIERHKDLEPKTAGKLNIYPVNVYHPDQGFKGWSKDDGDFDGILSVRDKVLSGQYSAETRPLERQMRGALIFIGKNAPVSGNLEKKDFASFYDILKSTCTRLFDDKAYTKFMLKRIRIELRTEATDLFTGYNMHPLSKEDTLTNLEAANRVVGYRFGPIGRLVFASGKLLDRAAPAPNRWVDISQR